MDVTIIVCFAFATVCLFVQFFTEGNRGSAQTALIIIGFIATALVFVLGGIITYLNGWRWLLIYILYIFIAGPVINVLAKYTKGY